MANIGLSAILKAGLAHVALKVGAPVLGITYYGAEGLGAFKVQAGEPPERSQRPRDVLRLGARARGTVWWISARRQARGYLGVGRIHVDQEEPCHEPARAKLPLTGL